MTYMMKISIMLSLLNCLLASSNDRIINTVYSPFYLSQYAYQQDEGTPLMIRIAQDQELVFIASGIGGIIVMDQIGENKLFQQKIDAQYISSFDVSRDGLMLMIGQKLKMSIYQFNSEILTYTSTSLYNLKSQVSFPSEILDLIYLEDKQLVVAAGLSGYVVVYAVNNTSSIQEVASYNTQSPQITSIHISSDYSWIYLSCDIVGVIVLRLIQNISNDQQLFRLVLASQGQGYKKSWQVIATSDNQYIYQVENWYGIFYANNNQVLASKIEDYPITLQFTPYWPLKQYSPLCNTLLISSDDSLLFVGVRSIGLLIFDISKKEDIQFFQHIQIDALATSAILSKNENYIYYSNSLSVFTFQKSVPNLQNDYPNIFNAQQALQLEMDGMYKWRCYVDPTNQYLIGAFDYSGFYIIPFYQDPLNLLLNNQVHLDIESDSMFLDESNQLLFIPSLFSKQLINVFRIGPTNDDPHISLMNPQQLSSFSQDYIQMAEQLIFSQDKQYAMQTYQTCMLFFNMTDPLNIKLLYQWSSPPQMVGEICGGAITDDNNWIIGTVRNYGIYVLDIKNKTNLVLTDSLETLGGESIFLSKILSQYAYLMDGMRGFAILDLSVLPKIKVISRVTLPGWTQLGIPIFQDDFILVCSQDNGMLSLIDMKNKLNPYVISTYRKDKQFAVSICTTIDEKYVFITNPQGIITLPLFSKVMIHTEVSEILVSSLTGFQIIQRFQRDTSEINAGIFLFQVGQQIQLNFVILYPQEEDMSIVSIQVYESNQIIDIPYYMKFDYTSQTLIMSIDKLAQGDERDQNNQNIILIKTTIPLSLNSFIYYASYDTDIAITNDQQAAIILKYLIKSNYLDSKNIISNNFDSTKQFQFDDYFLPQFEKLYVSNIDNFDDYVQLLENKIRITLMQTSFINPFKFYVKSSLSLQFDNPIQYIQSPYSTLIDVYLQVSKGGKFISRDYQGVITSTSALGDEIKIEGSLMNINLVLEQQIIFYHDKSIELNQVNVQITVIDNINYPLIITQPMIQCSFIILKKQLVVYQSLQQQIEKKFTDSEVCIVTDLSIQFSPESFFVEDSKDIVYTIQQKTTKKSEENQDGYEDLSPDFWLQSYSKQQLNYQGKIPTQFWNQIFWFKVIADDGYTQAEDYFYLKADCVPFQYIIGILFQILGPIIAIFQIYQKRFIVVNMYYRKRVIFDDEYAYCGENYSKKIIILGKVGEDAKIMVTALLKKVNSEKKIDIEQHKDEEDNYDDSNEIIQNISKNPNPNNSNQVNFNQYSGILSLNVSTRKFTSIPSNLPFFKQPQKNLTFTEHHKLLSNSEKKYLKKNGCISMKAVITEIVSLKLAFGQNSYLGGLIDYTEDLQNGGSRIHKAVKAQLARYFLSLNKRSQLVYNCIKQYSIKKLNKNERQWYKSIVKELPTEEFNEDNTLVIFPKLDFNYKVLIKIFMNLKLLQNNFEDSIESFDQLYNVLNKQNAGINIFLIKEVIFADVFGLILDLPSSMHVAQGESIHLHPYQIKSIQAYKRVNCRKLYRPILSFFNLEFSRYGVSKNMRLPTWITLDKKHGILIFKGIPSNLDIDEVLIRIYDIQGYVVKSFMLNIISNPNKKQYSSRFSIPDEDHKIRNNLESFQANFLAQSILNQTPNRNHIMIQRQNSYPLTRVSSNFSETK